MGSLKIPDNIMARPMMPGGLSDGTENVTRQFGNQEERVAAMPNVPNGWGGVANPAAGVEGQAAARAAESIANSALDTVTYFDNLRTAEEDSRSKLMFLELDKKEAEIRSKLDADPEYGKKSTAEQQSIYEMERDTAFDGIHQNYGFSQKKVVKAVETNLAIYKAQTSERYMEKVVKPRVIEQSKINDTTSDSMVIDKVAVEPNATNVALAAKNILERYDSPTAYATYGAQGALALKNDAIKKLANAVSTASIDSLQRSELGNLTGPAIDMDNLKSGEVARMIGDQKGVFNEQIKQLPLTEEQKLVLTLKNDKLVEDFAKRSVSDHNKKVKEDIKERLDAVQDTLATWSSQLRIAAHQGQLTEKKAFIEYTKLVNDPNIKNDPQAVNKATVAYETVSHAIVQFGREQRRLASEAKTRDAIAQLRVDNGVDVSGGALDSVWKKNGNLKSFFDNGNQLSPAHLSDIEKSGAVPTSVLGSIQSDLRSQNPNDQKRGIKNLLDIKNASSKSQSALYRDLPNDFAGVIQRIENGQTPSEALSFLTRPKNTPDVEKKLRNLADDKVNVNTMADVASKAKFDLSKMSGAMKEEATEMWRDAYARANGDLKLAGDLFHQDLSKNRTWGESKFSNKIEKYPLTNFTGSKEVAETIIKNAMPELKDKDVLPVFDGLKTINGAPTPTYKIYTKDENGILTTTNKMFYATKEEVAAVGEKERTQALEKAIAKNQEIKDNQRYWEQKQEEMTARATAKKNALRKQ